MIQSPARGVKDRGAAAAGRLGLSRFAGIGAECVPSLVCVWACKSGERDGGLDLLRSADRDADDET